MRSGHFINAPGAPPCLVRLAELLGALLFFVVFVFFGVFGVFGGLLSDDRPRAPATGCGVVCVPPDMFWMVALLAIDGRQYVYRVYAPATALLADVFWAAFHCHDEGPHPRACDRFDSAEMWHRGTSPGI